MTNTEIKILRKGLGATLSNDWSVTASVDERTIKRTVIYADKHEVRVDCDGERVVTMSWDELYAASQQTDPVAPVYSQILDLALDRRAHYEGEAAHAKLMTAALTGVTRIYLAAEHDSTNVWWVSVIRAGDGGYDAARPLSLRGLPVTVYARDEGGTLPSRHLAELECRDIAERIRKIWPNARVHVVGGDR